MFHIFWQSTLYKNAENSYFPKPQHLLETDTPHPPTLQDLVAKGMLCLLIAIFLFMHHYELTYSLGRRVAADKIAMMKKGGKAWFKEVALYK